MFRKIRLLSRRFKKSAAIPPAILQTDSIDTNYHLEQQQQQHHEARITKTTNHGVYEEKKYNDDDNDDEKTDISPLGCESVKQIINFNPYPFIPPIEISIPVKITTCYDEDEDDDHQIIQLDDSKTSKIRRFQFLVLRKQQSCGSRIECQDTIDVFTGIRSTNIHYIKRPTTTTNNNNNNNEGSVVVDEDEKEEEERVSYYTGPTDMLSDGSHSKNNTNNRTIWRRSRRRRKGVLRSKMNNMFLLRRSTSNTNTTKAKIQKTSSYSSGNVELNSVGFLA